MWYEDEEKQEGTSRWFKCLSEALTRKRVEVEVEVHSFPNIVHMKIILIFWGA